MLTVDQVYECPTQSLQKHVADKLTQREPGGVELVAVVQVLKGVRACVDVWDEA